MMERLTFRKNEKTYVRLNNLCFADRQVAERMMCSGCHIHINDTWRENEDYRKKCGPLAVIDRLADYEDLGTVEALSALVKAKEEGRLVELPCKVGDTVYWGWTDGVGALDGDINEVEVYQICITKNGVELSSGPYDGRLGPVGVHPPIAVFLTSAEAQAAFTIKAVEAQIYFKLKLRAGTKQFYQPG